MHPRDFGSFPKVLNHYVKKKRMITWEEAINKITGRPAEKFGIKKRGFVKIGNYADIVIFNPEIISDMATINKPYQYPIGIDCVLVNGNIALEDGVLSEERFGRALKK